MRNKRYFKILLFILCTIALHDNALSQRTWCSNMCNWNFIKNYDLTTQKNDFEKLAELSETSDSIEILQLIIQFDCKNEIGQKAKQYWDEILQRQFESMRGEWIFEWIGSDWDTGEIRSDTIDRRIIIGDDQIEIVNKEGTYHTDFEIQCVGIDYLGRIFLLIKLNTAFLGIHTWKFSLDNNLWRNGHAMVDVPDAVQKKDKFLYLMCESWDGNAELYYSKK